MSSNNQMQISQENIPTDYFYNNKQEIIITTSDKAELTIIKHYNKLKARTQWSTPLVLIISLLSTLITSEFKYIIICPSHWQIIYYSIFIGSVLWLLYCIFKSKESGVKNILNGLKMDDNG